MKTMLVAAATVLALSAGSAYAEGEGSTYVGEQWAARNGIQSEPAMVYAKEFQVQPQQHVVASTPFQTQDGNG